MELLTRTRKTNLTPVDRIRDEFERALQQLWNGSEDLADILSNDDWLPQVELSESEHAVQVKFGLPGIRPEDVEISLTDDRLVIQGKRQEAKEANDKTYDHNERSSASFYRSITLPPGIDSDYASATSENGVITVTVLKRREARAKRIKIQPIETPRRDYERARSYVNASAQ